MDPWKSWTIVGVLGAGAAYYYSQSGKSRKGRAPASFNLSEQSGRRTSELKQESKDTRKKKGKAKASDASDQAASDVAEVSSTASQNASAAKTKKRKGEKKQPSQLAQSSRAEMDQERVLDRDEDEEDEISNKEFAKHLSGLKTGTLLKKAETNKENKKTRKQGKAQQLPVIAANGNTPRPNGMVNGLDMSTASSATGADADDDLSLPVSPDFGATQATTPSGADISDMLEAPAKVPSILRLTEPTNPQPAKQAKAKKTAPEPETKKQRQNRQRNEERKALREQSEQERRVLLEKQLRTAREAEGRPAKNGLGSSKAPLTNAWDKPTTSSASAPKSENGPLLDTFEEDSPFTGPISNNTDGKVSKATTDPAASTQALPSEEEQLRLINEMDNDSTWNTVPKSGKGRKKQSNDLHTQENDGSSMSGREKMIPGTNKISQPTDTNNASTNATAHAYPQSFSNGDKAVDLDSNTSVSQTSDTMPFEKPGARTESTSSASDEEESPKNGVAKTHDDGEQAKRKKATYKTIDHEIWTRENIHEHPDYDPAWPYALTGHPMDSDWAADWDADDMKKGNLKTR